jgi:hypothetical protein
VQEGFDLLIENFSKERPSAKWIGFNPLLRQFKG